MTGGNLPEVATLYEQFERRTRYLSLRFGLRPQDSEDLRQEAFLILLRRGPAISDKLSWLIRTFCFLAVNQRRTFNWRKIASVDSVSLVLLAGIGPDAAARQDLRLDLLHLCRRLPARQRRLLQHYLLGHTEDELALSSGRLANSVRQDRLRVFRRLRELLETS